MQDPLNGAIVHALDPGDFVRLVLENITVYTAGWHGERLPVCSRLDQDSTLRDGSQQAHQQEENETA